MRNIHSLLLLVGVPSAAACNGYGGVLVFQVSYDSDN